MFDIASAKFQLVENSTILQLPGLVRSLHKHVADTSRVVHTLDLPGLLTNHMVDTPLGQANKSISFGKKTVNVVAAVRTIFSNFTTKPDKSGMADALKWSAYPGFPSTIVSRLLAISEGRPCL